MKIQAYIYHKRAEKYSDCQDYFGIDTQNNRIAVSDGMSQSIYPQWWAKILVNAYLSIGHIPESTNELQYYQNIWQEKLRDEIVKRDNEGRNPWRLKNFYAERFGAATTLCGFEWDSKGWKCECIGDSSLIIINNDYSIKILSSQEGDFGNHPDYLDSFRNGRGSIKRFNDSFEGINAILLVTDPYSELFQKHLSDKEFIRTHFEEILALTDHKSYSELVETWRDNLNMHNDDSTIIVLSDFSTSNYTPAHIDNLEELCRKEYTKQEEDKINETNNVIILSSNSNNSYTNEDCGRVNSQIEESSESQLVEDKEDIRSMFLQYFEKMLFFYNGKSLTERKIINYVKKIIKPITTKYPKK